MKKTIIMAELCILVLLFSSPGVCEILNCAGVPGIINRGNDGGQENCFPFDFENSTDYMMMGTNRAVCTLCDCMPDSFETVVAGDIINISMEILVDRGNGLIVGGDNGVYWAQDISYSGIAMETYSSLPEACQDWSLSQNFLGAFNYFKANGSIGIPSAGFDCDIADNKRVVKFQPDPFLSIGYGVTADDELQKKSVWTIDIPEMRVDPDRLAGGDKVWVKICLERNFGIMQEECCNLIFIGQLGGESVGAFYELYYLARNPDVAKSVEQGIFGTGWEHYQIFGKAEHRRYDMPDNYADFNEGCYLARNPDVARAVKRGIFGTGWEHYQLFGKAEHRRYDMPGEYEGVPYGGVSP